MVNEINNTGEMSEVIKLINQIEKQTYYTIYFPFLIFKIDLTVSFFMVQFNDDDDNFI